ncbi:hypothetical protein [Leuconostoc citreum]|uniref:hypothetical protein n=1 Tax=Leuconostoc citreum TaxID=33964 RepID=UPI00313431E4
MPRLFVRNTEEAPISSTTHSDDMGYYITDIQDGSIISKQDITDKFGIFDKELLNLFGNDGIVFEEQDDARKVALAIKDSF